MTFYSSLPLTKANPNDAGWDIVSTEDYTFEFFGDSHLFSTNLYIALPPGTYGRLASRSGLAVKNNIEVGAGVIDESYRGEVKVLLRYFGKQGVFNVEKGMRIAQLIICPLWQGSNKLTSVEQFPTGDRGNNGFGSSGLK